MMTKVSPNLYFAVGIVLLHFSSMVEAFRCDNPDRNVTGRSFIPGEKWPSGIVKYELNSSLTSADRVEAQKAINDIHAKTCIRFQPRSAGEASYVSLERDDTVCGLGSTCRLGGYQFARFGRHCANMNTMVHELGHNLCLGHEQQRRDRDDYLHFNGCNAAQIPGKNDYDTRGHLYDYASVMSYQCDACVFGFPRISGVYCGPAYRPGLSVLDADKLNDFYDCKGCFAHRWRPIDALTNLDIQGLIPVGRMSNGIPLYVCRGYAGSEISVGKFRLDTRTCWLPGNGVETILQNKAQVLTFPPGSGGYDVVPVTSFGGRKPVPAGRRANGMDGYAAVAEISGELAIGKVWLDDMSRAYIPYGGREVTVSNFRILVC